MLRLASLAWVWLALVGAALAQEYGVTPPQVIADDSVAIEWLITLVFLVACGVVAFKPAKRSNLR